LSAVIADHHAIAPGAFGADEAPRDIGSHEFRVALERVAPAAVAEKAIRDAEAVAAARCKPLPLESEIVS